VPRTNPQSCQIDAERLDDFAVMGACLDHRTEARAFDDEPDGSHGHDRHTGSPEAIGRPDQIEHDKAAGHVARYRHHVVARAPHHADQFLQHHSNTKGEQKPIERIAPIRAAHQSLEHKTKGRN
jgi:hypothetical protein